MLNEQAMQTIWDAVSTLVEKSAPRVKNVRFRRPRWDANEKDILLTVDHIPEGGQPSSVTRPLYLSQLEYVPGIGLLNYVETELLSMQFELLAFLGDPHVKLLSDAELGYSFRPTVGLKSDR